MEVLSLVQQKASGATRINPSHNGFSLDLMIYQVAIPEDLALLKVRLKVVPNRTHLEAAGVTRIDPNLGLHSGQNKKIGRLTTEALAPLMVQCRLPRSQETVGANKLVLMVCYQVRIIQDFRDL